MCIDFFVKQEGLVKKDKTGTTKIENDGYWVLLVVSSAKGYYHWYRQNPDGSWSHKMAWLDAENLGFIDPVKHVDSIYYERTVGYFYVNKGG